MRGLVLDFGGVLAGPGTDGRAVAEVVAALRERGVRTAILSNDPGGPGADRLRRLGGGRFVDEVVLSGDVGVAKPDPRSYLLVAERLGLEPAQCVFVDDLVVNVRGAAAAGMVGVHHERPDVAVAELTVLFELSAHDEAPVTSVPVPSAAEDAAADRGEGDTR
ncbi:HAD family hydrolase [Rhodococcus phenolicus]|uniref:HAD family hydrolase n=1 Tax=Rhodococcus phenolicus TaxID=263849 RepID=UPI0009EE4EBD|nr:HAD-IA family hydrolase [Rhodococcus phenolicus]